MRDCCTALSEEGCGPELIVNSVVTSHIVYPFDGHYVGLIMF